MWQQHLLCIQIKGSQVFDTEDGVEEDMKKVGDKEGKTFSKILKGGNFLPLFFVSHFQIQNLISDDL